MRLFLYNAWGRQEGNKFRHVFDMMAQCHLLGQLCRDGFDIEAIRLAIAHEPTTEVRSADHHLFVHESYNNYFYDTCIITFINVVSYHIHRITRKLYTMRSCEAM